jgi:phage terminase large subunit
MQLDPYDEQTPFLGKQRRYYGFISGIGAGKTFVGILRALLNARRWNPGSLGAIIAPTGTNIRDIILPEMRDLGIMDIDGVEYRGKSAEEPGLHFANGSRIILEGADNRRKIERLRGLNLAWWWMDEAAIIPEQAWDILTGRLRQGEYRNGFVTTTPKGQNWVYERFVDDVAGEYEQHGDASVYADATTLSLLEVPTHANPHNPSDYQDNVEEEYEGAFYRQEVLGEFTRFDGLVYPWFREDDHTAPAEALPDRFDRVVYGVDWGFSNPSVILTVGYHDGRPIVLDEVYESRLTVEDMAARLGTLQSEHGTGVVYCDPAEPASIEQLQRAGYDAVAADNDVQPGIQHVASRQDAILVAERCQNLVNEFGMYQYRDGGDSDKVRKEHDHAMDALRYALYSSDRQGGVATARASFGDAERPPPDESGDQQTIGDVLPDPTNLGGGRL